MFWKTVNKFFLKHPRQWSITFRLTLIYSLSALGVLIISTFTLYWIFTNRLEQENHKFLVNNILVLKKVLENQENVSQNFLHEEIVIEPAIYQYFVRVINDKGDVLLETPGMREKVPETAFNKIQPEQPDIFRSRYWNVSQKDHRTRHYLLMTASVDQDRVIQIAKDISTERSIVTDYRQGLLIVLLMGVIGAAGMGMIVTRKGLQPLREMTRSTQRISIARLKERLDPTLWPSELSELAVAFNSMLDRVEEGFTRLSQFSGDLAHECRTPITNLMGEAEIILSR